MTVGGNFEARTASLTGSISLGTTGSTSSAPSSGGSEGRFAVDLRTLDTGIDLRNEHLRRTYLEVDKGEGFNRATLSDVQLGDLNIATLEGKTPFTATLLLHGTKKPIKGQAEIRRNPAGLLIEATFPVTLADFGIPKPQYLGVGVKSQVQVKVSMAATQ
jgi:YceI-like domain